MVWLLLRGVMFWAIWIARNDLTFNNIKYDTRIIQQMIWQRILEYTRIAWDTKADKEFIYNDTIEKYD